ncbi:MAG: VWA domain-containing protein [Pseudomonadota bacterium]
MADPPKYLRKRSAALTESDTVDGFLKAVEATPAPLTQATGRLVFALDATASRQPTWNEAMALQQNLFVATDGIQGLDVQLVFFRGDGECRATPWHTSSDALLRAMRAVRCAAGQTQIGRVLRHVRTEARARPLSALVYVGDCCEERFDPLAGLAGDLRLLGVPLFLFQEGNDPVARDAFGRLAAISGGAYARFDLDSRRILADLLAAVGTWARGGTAAVQTLQLTKQSATIAGLLRQLEP